MKVQNQNVTIYAGAAANSRKSQNLEQSQNEKTGNHIFAGNLNLQEDNIELKRKEAMKKALKIVGDAFDGELKTDDGLNQIREKITGLEEEIHNAQKELNSLNDSKRTLKETYGITEGSQEQMDLELLEKRRASQKDPSIQLTEEEKQRLSVIDEAGQTEYQQASLEIDRLMEPHAKIISDNQNKIIGGNRSIEDMKLEKMKSHTMVDATAAADDILKDANSQIAQMLLEEAKDQVDQKLEEEKDAADKKAEEQKEQDEKVEAIKEKKEAIEALADRNSSTDSHKDSSVQKDSPAKNVTEQMLQLDDIKNDVQKEVQEMLDKMKLLEEDIKGAVVDAVL